MHGATSSASPPGSSRRWAFSFRSPPSRSSDGCSGAGSGPSFPGGTRRPRPEGIRGAGREPLLFGVRVRSIVRPDAARAASRRTRTPTLMLRLLPLHVVALVAALLPWATSAQQRPAAARPADLIVTNARIYTVDDGRPMAEAMAVRDGRVEFVGSERGALAHRGTATRVLDLAGRTVIPGMVDAHAHLRGLGEALRSVDLTGTRSYDEVIARVAARAKELPAGSWVIGRGWDQNDWADTRFPTHEALSRAVPAHPVFLERVDGHAAIANARAMQAANLSATATDPAGGRIERMAGGAPSGVFVDDAMGLVAQAIPPLTRAEVRSATVAAIREANKWGLTGIHDAGVSRETIDVYESLAAEGKYDLRNYVMISSEDETIDHYLRRGAQNGLHGGRLWIRSIKISADGALGSRGAALLEPYSDEPSHSGLVTTPP